jgi:tetratricopeptide (TPR) repeat protein
MDLKGVPLIGVCLLSAISSFAQSPPDKQQQVATHTRQAGEFLKNSRPDLAAREFQAILALDPDNIDARGNLGVLLYFQGDFAKAAPELRSVLKLRPELPKIQALLGMCEKRMGQIAAAQLDLEKSFPQLNEPKDEKLRVQVGLELIEIDYGSGDLDKAAGVVTVLRQLKPADIDILYTAHRIYADLTDETLLSVAMLAPNSGRMHQLMAHEMARQGNIEGAIMHDREAIKIEPKLPGIHFELAELLRTSTPPADPAIVESEYKAALADNPFDEKSECRLADIAARQPDPKSAAAHYSRALELQPNDADANLGYAKILITLNQPEKAEILLERAARLEPYNAATHYRLATVYRTLGRAADARRELAEFQRLSGMKEHLKEMYQEMRLQPGKPDSQDSDAQK